MASQQLNRRIEYPGASVATGPLYAYLARLARALNDMPVLSYTSYSGGPNSRLTGAPGDLCVNSVSSAQTARLFVKELGSGTTGWVSFSTIP